MRTRFTALVGVDAPISGAKGRIALETGDLDAGLIWAGQVQGLIHDIPTCADLIARIMSEANTIARRFNPLAEQRIAA